MKQKKKMLSQKLGEGENEFSKGKVIVWDKKYLFCLQFWYNNYFIDKIYQFQEVYLLTSISHYMLASPDANIWLFVIIIPGTMKQNHHPILDSHRSTHLGGNQDPASFIS